MNNNKTRQADYFENKAVLTIIIVFAAGILFMDIACANIYKLIKGYAFPENAQIENTEIERSYRMASRIYHHGLIPNKSVDKSRWGKFKSYVRTNSLGFRDSKVRDVSLVSDKYRIIFIGDSFTEGVGIEYNNTFVGLIDEALSKKGIETLNASATSYSPIIYWRKVKYLIEDMGIKFDELVVFLDISDVEDEARYYFLDENENVRGKEIIKKKKNIIQRIKDLPHKIDDAFKDNSILIYTLVNETRIFLKKTLKQRTFAVNLPRSLWTIKEEAYRDYAAPGLQKMELYMNKLEELLKEHNIKLTVAVYPWPDQIINGDLCSSHVVFWQEWCAKKKVKFIDYFPYFVTGKTKKERFDVLRRYFIDGDVHWNEEGNRLIAEVFLHLAC